MLKLDVSPSAIGDLLFGQQHVHTQDYFTNLVGNSHTVRMADSPHVLFATSTNRDEYVRYLQTSWEFYFPQLNTAEKRLERVSKFKELIQDVKENGVRTPISVYERPTGELVVLDGNHRCAAALAAGVVLPAIVKPAKEVLTDLVNVDAGFYSMRKGRPYQSLFYNGEEVIEGRRPDMLSRMKMIDKKDLQGTVLDIGCNIGGNAFLASQLGAQSVVGVDSEVAIVNSAIRLNNYFATNSRFAVGDAGTPLDLEPADTVLCFSVWAHVANKEQLIKNLLSLTNKVLYFECHSGTSKEDYPELLNKDNFSSIRIKGYGQAGIHSSKKDRPLYRCVVR
jgi:hypothetical protein